ncbi:MAG: hypothetical protein FJ090_20095, partial [Deltaproteobacteria bacterium]|nr:hypothetical protein [Deltaproteobacteria bacterium]
HLDELIAEAGVLDALALCAGPVGLRRFVVRAELREGRVRVVGLDAPCLARGGGPPSAFEAGASRLETALTELRRRLPRHQAFGRVAVGFVRDTGEGSQPELFFRFDDDGVGFGVHRLREPAGDCAPLEDPAYLRALADWASRLEEVRGNWQIARGDWMFESGRLDDGERAAAATAIGTWHPTQGRFSWLLVTPAGEEGPFVEPDVFVDLAGATELACFAAARLGAAGVFQGTSEQGQQFFAALRE